MVHVRFINDQETVVTVPVCPDVDRWVLAVMPVKIKLELLRDTLGVNGGRDTDAAFTQHEQDRFVHIVVDKHDRTPGRLYQIGGENAHPYETSHLRERAANMLQNSCKRAEHQNKYEVLFCISEVPPALLKGSALPQKHRMNCHKNTKRFTAKTTNETPLKLKINSIENSK